MENCPHCERQKHMPRSEEEIKALKSRLNRLVGQLNGISKMLDENRYCGDILIQIAACERALQEVGYLILEKHMETCVSEDIKDGKEGVIPETMDLIRKLK